MAKTLLVPDHILEKKKDKAYVKKEERVLDPTLLDKHLKKDWSTSWLEDSVAPYQGKEVTDKGVIIPDQIRQREALQQLLLMF